MDPLTLFGLIMETMKEGFRFGTQALLFLMTDQGQKLVELFLNDRAKWDAFWAPVVADVSNGWKALLAVGKSH